ncbi:MAG TPA: UPF0182 family protein [Terriglobales bacterium]|nr:UPF0182 family protein [Terriglobales bacterium]
MPVQSTVHTLKVTRPEIYFGELTNTDVYVKTRQKEFNYPQDETNNLNSYEGNGGIVLGGFLRRAVIAHDRGDLAKLPFSDDVNQDSRLLMRRTLRDRVSAIAPFLTYDPDPYIVLGDDGRLSWIMDAFTVSGSYPYSNHYRRDGNSINYLRNTVKVVIDAYDGTTTFYVFYTNDPIIDAYRQIFPSLFKDAAMMPHGLRKHVRYPELLLKLQAEVYWLYHMTDPEAFYNRGDLWTVTTEVGLSETGEQTTQEMPELRLVVLALQDRLAYGPSFESAMAAPFGGAASSMNASVTTASTVPAEAAQRTSSSAVPWPAADLNALITQVDRELADYQHLTAEGKLAEAGQKLEDLKRTLDKLNKLSR